MAATLCPTPRRRHVGAVATALADETRAVDPVSLTLGTVDAMPGFYGGDHAMLAENLSERRLAAGGG